MSYRPRSAYRQRPGFGGEQRLGDWRVIDDRTGFKVWASDCRMEWDNLFVVDADKRNPQDFVTGVPDPQVVMPTRPDVTPDFVPFILQVEVSLLPFYTEDGQPLEGTA